MATPQQLAKLEAAFKEAFPEEAKKMQAANAGLAINWLQVLANLPKLVAIFQELVNIFQPPTPPTPPSQ